MTVSGGEVARLQAGVNCLVGTHCLCEDLVSPAGDGGQ